jgi:tetratricopeptide (TPR) repeat protein
MNEPKDAAICPPELSEALRLGRQPMPIEDPAAVDRTIDVLRKYECWIPLRSMLQRLSKKSPRDQNLHFEIARAAWDHERDVPTLASKLGEMISAFTMDFDDFDNKIRRPIFPDEEWEIQASLLEALVSTFVHKADQTRCLERIALIYEKKWLNEEKLYRAYAKLLKLDPNNIRALKYFKVISIQSQDWDQALGYLQRLLEVSRQNLDRFRHAQEMAAIELYHRNNPRMALQLLETYCKGSPLDDSAIAFDAHMRLEDYEGCLRILRRFLDANNIGEAGEVIHFRIGQLEEMRGQLNQAMFHYRESLRIDPEMVEAAERVILILLRQEQWEQVSLVLQSLMDLNISPAVRTRLREALQRLQALLEQAAPRS